MSRRIGPGAFWVGILGCALLMLLAGNMRASGPPRPLDAQGNWDGFFLADDGATGSVRSVITQQNFRRVAGEGELLDSLGDPLLAYIFNATVAQPDFLAGSGATPTGRLGFQAGLENYSPQPPVRSFQTGLAPRAGYAAVMYPEFHLVPSHGGASRVSAMLLHPFLGVAPPDITGRFQRPFQSQNHPITGSPAAPRFTGFGTMEIQGDDHGLFGGHVDLFLDSNPSNPFISWPFLATVSDDGRILWISQQKRGRILYDGVVITAPNHTITRIDGILRLFLSNGRTLYNSVNTTIASR